MSNKIKKHITFSDRTIQIVETRARDLGLEFSEYVRFVITRDIDQSGILLSLKTEKDIEDSILQFSTGKFKQTSTKTGLKNFLNEIKLDDKEDIHT